MTQKIALLTLSMTATAAIGDGVFVTLDGLPAEPGGSADGLAAAQAAVGEVLPVDVIGTSIATAGTDLTAGQALQVGEAGVAVPHTTGALVAKTLQAAGEGERVEVLLIQGGLPAASSGG